MTEFTFSKPSSASNMVMYSISTPTSLGATVRIGAKNSAKSSKDIENAVYGYLQAIRALGRTELNVSDVSQALNIDSRLVITALQALRKKGVKLG